jgi:hypothetical protein
MQRPIFRGLRVLALLAALACLVPAAAEDASGVALAVDRAEPAVGEVVTLTLRSGLLPEGRLPETFQVKGLEGFTLLEPPHKSGQDRIEMRLLVDRIEPFSVGPLGLVWQGADGAPRALTSQALTLSPVSNLGARPEEAELKPIEDIDPVGRAWLRWLLWLALAAALLLLVGAAVRYFVKRRRAARLLSEPPHVRACRELMALQARGFLEPGQAKAFYFRFSEVLRRYLEELRGFPAAEYTTPEIAAALTDDRDRVLLPLLRHADLVKFADLMATPDQKEDALAQALAYVQATGEAFETPASKLPREQA